MLASLSNLVSQSPERIMLDGFGQEGFLLVVLVQLWVLADKIITQAKFRVCVASPNIQLSIFLELFTLSHHEQRLCFVAFSNIRISHNSEMIPGACLEFRDSVNVFVSGQFCHHLCRRVYNFQSTQIVGALFRKENLVTCDLGIV